MNQRRCKYIVIEGLEGVGKTTQTLKLTEFLRSKGYNVLMSKEPGTPHAPLTMVLRGIMLDQQYDSELTPIARELISQSIRSIHLEKVILPAMQEYDYIIQDRGILSGLAYGSACGNNSDWLVDMAHKIVPDSIRFHYGKLLYNNVIRLRGDISTGLSKALSCKQEFAAGDAMESKGSSFLHTVADSMDSMSRLFNVSEVNIDGKGIEEVFQNILQTLKLEN